MANVKPFTRGQKIKVERMISEALETLDQAHREELRSRADAYQRQAKDNVKILQTYQDRIAELRDLTKAMAKELSRR